MRINILLTLLFAIIVRQAAAQQQSFDVFVQKQDSLFTSAYEARNITLYQQLLNQFTRRFRKINNAEKSKYRGYLQNVLYNLSCTYSLLNKHPEALHYLKQAIESGYTNYAHLMEDKDLDNIRQDPEFSSLIIPLRAVGDYQFILSKAVNYNYNELRELPVFTYQDSANVNLALLRAGFNLDSIAGSGGEILKMINLMHWVHTLIPHDGNHNNPAIKNALSLIAVCKKENRGLNCRGLATVLNECYLAMGFSSRFITCLPKDSLKTDPDCHVINMVFSNTLQKWIWMDPTNDAYVTNEKGELLSIEEARMRIATNRPVLLNPSANWNNKVSQTKAGYLDVYMAKNLYMLQCSNNSEYDAETSENGKSMTYITLVPLEYYRQQKEKLTETNEKTNTSYTWYQTNNPAYFWQSPAQKSLKK